MPRHVPVAVVQAAPLPFDRDGTLAKTVTLLRQAANKGVKLVLFPEAFIPAYPRGFSFGMIVGSRTKEGRDLWRGLWEQAVEIPSPLTAALAASCRELGVHCAIGVIERERDIGQGTLYCTLLTFGPDGTLLHKHRKLKPTGSERLIWGEGDGSTLNVLDTPVGRIGGLICWENYMPMARMALYGQGVEIYLAPTADPRDTWQATLRHIACEGRCFVLSSNQFVTKSMLPADLVALAEMKDQPDVLCRGGSAIIGPLGDVIAGPIFDREEILYATLDLDDVVRGKLDFDVVGHYARPDVFQLTISREPKLPIQFRGERPA